MDGGTSSKNGTLEKDINFSIAVKLKERLKKTGYEVVMTREEDAVTLFKEWDYKTKVPWRFKK